MAQGLLPFPGEGRRWLLAVAAPVEARAVLDGRGSARPAGGAQAATPGVRWTCIPAGDGLDMVVTGVGKANASAAVARAFDPARHAGVLSLGIGGSLPGSGLEIGEVV